MPIEKTVSYLMGFVGMLLAAFVILYIVHVVDNSVSYDDKVAYECAKHGNEFNRVDADGITNGAYECLKN